MWKKPAQKKKNQTTFFFFDWWIFNLRKRCVFSLFEELSLLIDWMIHFSFSNDLFFFIYKIIWWLKNLFIYLLLINLTFFQIIYFNSSIFFNFLQFFSSIFSLFKKMDIKLKHPYLCTREECFYQEPFILSYYRRRLTFSQCLKSLFILHNETANVWTQIVGVIVFSLLFAYSLFSFLPSVTKGQENAMAQVLSL